MGKLLSIIICVMLLVSCSKPRQNNLADWKTELTETIEVFGHRNWIVVADAAYPEQSNPAIKTITIDANQLEAVELVSNLIEKSNHVGANIFVDKEMAFVPEKDAMGIEDYRTSLSKVLEGKPVKPMLHEAIIRELDASAKLFKVLIIKTDLAIPYTSVFFQLECDYWNAKAEENMRNEMTISN